MTKKKICIVEDDPDLRDAMGLMIQYTQDYELSGSFKNSEEALENIPVLSPDAILMDINLPGESGITCVRKIKSKLPQVLILMCTSYEDEDKIFASLQEGATGYILKTEGPAKIISALDELFEGGSPMSGSIARKVVASFCNFENKKLISEGLTAREQEILDLLSKGLMNKEVASILEISQGTVRKHIQNIYTKLHVNTRVEAVNIYLKR
ncbi:response regulator [Epilithonimonas hungarica]|jgi:Response regulator containing a CheY-like receiver domain and an HTH DNA-binding domain|uniref:Two component transcriptional regulator, LuxR family n=1 Tax=Epilithonimonas hungarica TaxID=454006 RepID=A0A1G7RJF3_9FLAO|nr:response regulator transcription factor [Epilithonimonas hungarica]MDP9955671.1 DNA-binding NarL/FixJ family response regulator [Epilithonimonas hungarica]MPT32136.1 response regulator transcription factor [Chryseobacterium sp.]SDG10892.1 two component transcriptional regulator, LuxR family [Epilithonimonas hungarica]